VQHADGVPRDGGDAVTRLLLLLCACDPAWNVHATVRDPQNQPVAGATVAVACPAGIELGAVARTDARGSAVVGRMGAEIPPGCDVFVVKPGYRAQRIRYGDLCPAGAGECPRVFSYQLVLEPW
jgi:hypothetical protein